jgi:hypothetical protein
LDEHLSQVFIAATRGPREAVEVLLQILDLTSSLTLTLSFNV